MRKTAKEILAESHLFGGLDDKVLDALSQGSHVRPIRADSYLFLQGDPTGTMFLIVEGRVAIEQTTQDGGTRHITVRNPGELIGEISLFERTTRTADARTMVDSTILRLDGEHVKEVLHRYPSLGERFILLLSQKLHQAMQRIEDLDNKLQIRVAKLLMNEAKDRGTKVDGVGIEFHPPLSQGTIAQRLNVSRESVNREISSLKRLGLVESTASSVVVRSIKGLKEIARSHEV